MYWKDRWWLVGRVRLVSRMEHDDQADILNAVAVRFGASKVGIDATEGEGRSIAQVLETTHGWGTKITRYMAQETLLAGWTPAKEDVAPEEVWENQRSIGTRWLRSRFAKQVMALPVGEEIPAEFNQEKEVRNQDGSTKVITPSTVHITDMMRVFAVMVFQETPLVPPGQDGGEFVDLEWGDRPSPWATSVGF
jgi:hypothetical protein